MPEHKSQHYVPQCHLRPFSIEREGAAIQILNLKSERLIRNAALRKQCAKSYFYGDDLDVEKRLQPVENTYGRIVSRIIAGNAPEAADLSFLRGFSLLQFLRTDFAAKRASLAQTEMMDLAQLPRDYALSEEEAARQVIANFTDTVDVLDDLKVRVLHNRTRLPFITSDDPAIYVNRLYSQRLGPRYSSAGIENAGLISFLPLSPAHALVCYDGDVYTCSDTVVTNESDIGAINALQYIKAANNVYFSDWAHGEAIKQRWQIVAHRRPAAWHKLHLAVRDGETPEGHPVFRTVYGEEERRQPGQAFIHLESVLLDPGTWCSKIKFRDKPIFVETGTGAGFLRRATQSRRAR